MDPDTKDLIIICDAYQGGQISHDDFHERMAALRDRKIERRKDPKRQGTDPLTVNHAHQ